ncbi:hypothetical protein Desti_5643 (plasmid) [Desulfomonile tiedjei DSM 6799]|uniref:Uncharacterized protein n=1 Tax=Desulfomonile tiedjei (strain ATCC 49306 / DSM 6799 / DCB-1) TaxID=706587 RepID=I4CF81_DESTA|nr:hypothetical protein Desti_5643 [Desulfomonile tiedjei DSM 6799]
MGIETRTPSGTTREIMVAENIQDITRTLVSGVRGKPPIKAHEFLNDINLPSVSDVRETTVLKLRPVETAPIKAPTFPNNIHRVINSITHVCGDCEADRAYRDVAPRGRQIEDPLHRCNLLVQGRFGRPTCSA